jgi:signal transduction histidine kinase
VGLLALLGSTDLREVNREVSVPHGLYNRSQIALSAMAASWTFHAAGGDLQSWPSVLGIALLALVADFAVNTSLVLLASRLLGVGVFTRLMKDRTRDQPIALLASYISFGLAAVLLAVLYRTAGNWGLIAFVTPIFLARQVFVQSRRLRDMADSVSEKSRMLLAVSERMAEERRDERLAVAAGLHDEVLPPLYKVHLLGQVVRQDLAAGRLLALEEDVPDLLRATETASDAMRILIRDLRGSPLGPGDLAQTLRLLARHLESDSTAQIHLDVETVGGSPLVQLLTYQVAREALRNAIRHAHASHVRVSLLREGSDMQLIVEDDGQGFEIEAVDSESHFGLQLMRERVQLAGGVFQVTSRRGQGTRVVAKLPAETATR